MQFKQIALAVAATLVAGHAAAVPVTKNDIAAARATSALQETWLSGASAPTFNVYQGFALGCDADSVAIFTTDTSGAVKPGSLGDNSAYACTRGGVVSVMYHTVAGGSFNAYAPHVNGTQLSRVKALDVDTACAAAGTFSFTAGTNTVTAAVNNKCTAVLGATAGDNAPALPAGGFSDVEAALFGFDVSGAGTEAQANVGQVFGLAVSTNLYRALQAAQGLSDVNATTFDPVNAPNLTSAQYVSIAAVSGGYHTDWSPILGTAGNGKDVHLARRVATSGTQASSNAHFLKNPCDGDPTVGGALFPATVADSGFNDVNGNGIKDVGEAADLFIVTENSGTSDVKKKLTSANGAGEYAIGVVSLENDWRSETKSDRNQYRFIKLDGIHPEAGDVANARLAALTGEYAFQMEMRNFTANSADAFGAQLITDITTALGNPATCTDVPRGLTLNPLGGSTCNYPGQPGASAGGSITDAEALTQPEVAKHTRFGNNCQATQLFF